MSPIFERIIEALAADKRTLTDPLLWNCVNTLQAAAGHREPDEVMADIIADHLLRAASDRSHLINELRIQRETTVRPVMFIPHNGVDEDRE